MTKEELKNKCTERAKIFQQAMESCKSSNPMDCIEWFADRIAELEKENAELKEELKDANEKVVHLACNQNKDLKKENAKLQGLVSQYKASKCSGISLANRNMIMSDQLSKAKELLKQWLQTSKASGCDNINIVTDTEQFLSEVENV